PVARITDGVHMEGEPLLEAEGPEEIHEHAHHFRVHGRARLTEGFHVGLVELAIASRLRSLVAEHGADRVETDGLRLDLEPVLDVGAHEPGGGLGTEGERVAAAVLEGVHLLLDDVRLVADAPREELRALEEREANLAIAVGFEGGSARGLHTLPAPSLRGENVPHATHGLDGHG